MRLRPGGFFLYPAHPGEDLCWGVYGGGVLLQRYSGGAFFCDPSMPPVECFAMRNAQCAQYAQCVICAMRNVAGSGDVNGWSRDGDATEAKLGVLW